MATDNKNNNLKNEKWQLWQWIVILGLIVAICVTAALYINKINNAHNEYENAKALKKIYDPGSSTAMDEIESYKKQLGKTNSYIAYNNLSRAYIKQARTTGDPSWYIFAEQNAKASLYNSPVNNYDAIKNLASINMAKHDFSQAIKLAKQIDEPNMIFEQLGIMFDAHYALGDLSLAQKDMSEIDKNVTLSIKEKSKDKSIQNFSASNFIDPVDNVRRALLATSSGDISGADKLYQKAVKDSIGLQGEPKAWVYSLYGVFLTKYGKLKEAKDNIQFALNSLDNYTSALVQKAEIQREEQKWSDVINTLTDVNKKIPRSDIILRLAEAEKKLNHTENYNKLLDQAETLLKQETSTGGFGHRRDYIRLLLERNTPQSIKEALNKSESEIKLRKDLDTILIVAETEIKNNDWTSAKNNLEQASISGVQDSTLFYLQGRVLENTNNLSEAKKYYNKALSINPIFNPDSVEYIKTFLAKVSK